MLFSEGVGNFYKRDFIQGKLYVRAIILISKHINKN